MRNLKKVLSLTLALVMLIGMMVVGAGATSFKDDKDIADEYKVAAAVLDQIGVMKGTELNGETNFNPKKVLTRVEGAALIYRLVTGGLSMNPAGESGFTDVDGTPNHGWASGTVAACRDLGIVSGETPTTFNPGGELTVAAFSKMLLVTLGYEDKFAGYSGESWESNVARDARARGILLNGLTMNAKLTREQAAQMAFQALTAEMVEYTGLNGSVGDATFNSPATVRRHTSATANNNQTYDRETVVSSITPIRLCEERFRDLKLWRSELDNTYGRTESVWKWKGVEIDGTKTAVQPDAVFTSEVKKAAVKAAINDNSSLDTTYWGLTIWQNGQPTGVVRTGATAGQINAISAEDIAKMTGNGRLVEIYLAERDKSTIAKIVIVDTALGTVTRVDEKNEEITIRLNDGETKADLGQLVYGDKIVTKVGYGDVKVDDVVLVQGVNADDGVINEDVDVLDVSIADTVVGKATRNTRGKAVTVDGTVYNQSFNAVDGTDGFRFGLTGKNDATLWLDHYGYIIMGKTGVETSSGPADNLILATDFVMKADSNNHLRWYVLGINSEGKSVEKQLADTSDPTGAPSSYTVGTVYEYDKTDKDLTAATGAIGAANYSTKLYWVTTATGAATGDISTSDRAETVDSRNCYYASDVKFIFVGSDGKKVSILTGMQNVILNTGDSKQNATQTVSVIRPNSAKTSGEICAVFVTAKTTKVPSGSGINDLIFVARQLNGHVVGASDETYGTYEAYVNGELIEDFYGDEDMAPGLYYQKKNDDGAYVLDGNQVESEIDRVSVSSMNTARKVMSLMRKDGSVQYVDITDNTVFVDTNDSRVDSMRDIQYALEDGESVVVSVVADSRGNALYVYVCDAQQATKVTVPANGEITVTPGESFRPSDDEHTITQMTVAGSTLSGFTWKSVTGNISDTMGFPFVGKATTKYTLKIVDKDGVNMWTESLTTSSTAGGKAFIVQVVNTTADGATSTTGNEQTGTSGQLKTTELDKGVYSWSITEDPDGTPEVIASGTFEITKN